MVINCQVRQSTKVKQWSTKVKQWSAAGEDGSLGGGPGCMAMGRGRSGGGVRLRPVSGMRGEDGGVLLRRAGASGALRGKCWGL